MAASTPAQVSSQAGLIWLGGSWKPYLPVSRSSKAKATLTSCVSYAQSMLEPEARSSYIEFVYNQPSQTMAADLQMVEAMVPYLNVKPYLALMAETPAADNLFLRESEKLS